MTWKTWLTLEETSEGTWQQKAQLTLLFCSYVALLDCRATLDNKTWLKK